MKSPEIDSLFIGNTEVNAVYLGSTLIANAKVSISDMTYVVIVINGSQTAYNGADALVSWTINFGSNDSITFKAKTNIKIFVEGKFVTLSTNGTYTTQRYNSGRIVAILIEKI